MAFNLFDFSSALNPLGNVSTAPQALPTIGGATGGGPKPPTPSSQPLPYAPVVKKPVQATPAQAIFPMANAGGGKDEKKIKDLIDTARSRGWEKSRIDNMIRSEDAKGTFNIAEQPIEPTPIVEPTKPGFFDRIGQAAEKRGTSILNAENIDQTRFEKGAQQFGQGLGFISDVGMDIAGSVLGPIVKNTSLNVIPSLLGKVAKETWNAIPEGVKEGTINAINQGGNSLETFKKENPRLSGDIGAVLNILGSIPSVLPAAKTIEATADISKSLPIVRNITGKSKILNRQAIKEGNAIITPSGKLVGTKGEQELAARQLIGASGTKYNADTAINASRELSKADIASINSSKEPARKTAEILDTKVKGLAKIQSDVASADKRALSKEAIDIVSSDGTIKHNYVNEGINKLLSKKVLTPDEEAFVYSLNRKLNGVPATATREAIPPSGITRKELSDLSIMMGEKSGKFTATTNGIVAKDEEFEMIRQGVKDAYRNNVDKSAVELDKKMHSLIDTRTAMRDMDEAVKNIKASYGEGIAYKISKLLGNISIRGPIKGPLVALGESGKITPGAMNPVDFENKIAKNLKLLQKLDEGLKKTNTEQEALNYIKSVEDSIIQGKIFPETPKLLNAGISGKNIGNLPPELPTNTSNIIKQSKEELSGAKITRERPYSDIVKEQMKGKTIQTKKMPTTIKREPIKKSKKEPPAPKAPIVNVKKYAKGEVADLPRKEVPKGQALYGKGKAPIRKPIAPKKN